MDLARLAIEIGSGVLLVLVSVRVIWAMLDADREAEAQERRRGHQ
jgi:hypothetical protein